MRMTVAFAEMNEALKADFSETTQKLAPEFDEMAVVNGKDGHTPVKGVDYYTDADKADMVSAVKASMVTEMWAFTLDDGSVVTKKVLVDV